MAARDLHRLNAGELAEHLRRCPKEQRDLIREIREFVLEVVPEVHEAIKFHSLCYLKPDVPYGSIGGHVCGIGVRRDGISLWFIHGAALPDPRGLLHGKAKSKRELRIESSATMRDPAIADLLRAACAYRPT